ncbi:sugar transferase [Muricauda sp. SCSIO 64092]|uniref:sugar transferase n=1 Tax=Allomuricauda sp. SCSIO 64092 TaxID=2908842 RepID=UPI001FF14D00|nr:sugar transferase [Muricauda sp. SCSIO 64092]UOY06101.1 sugar transferase [Muricauda sp. SCSIO 64092]
MKAIFDFGSALLGICILSPLLLIIAFLIKVTSKGPIFFKQTRVGLHEKDFKILKFRTMHVGSDKKGLLTVGNRDSRVTSVGVYLRKLKLDELPQLFNVLLGDMSLVGPRPEVRKYTELYSQDDKIIFSVKPGITDYASIHFRNENEMLKAAKNPEEKYISDILPKKLELNKEYINKKSFFVDVSIILQTFYAILLR